MQIITPEAYQKLGLRPATKCHPVRAAIESLKPGQILQIGRQEMGWKGKSPTLFCNRLSKTTKKRFKTERLTSGMGWVVTRLR